MVFGTVLHWATYVAVDGSNDHSADHHDPVGQRYIHLPMEFGASISRLDLREIGRMHELNKQLEGTGDESLRSDNGGENRKNKRRVEHARRHSLEEGIGIC